MNLMHEPDLNAPVRRRSSIKPFSLDDTHALILHHSPPLTSPINEVLDKDVPVPEAGCKRHSIVNTLKTVVDKVFNTKNPSTRDKNELRMLNNSNEILYTSNKDAIHIKEKVGKSLDQLGIQYTWKHKYVAECKHPHVEFEIEIVVIKKTGEEN